LDKTKTTDVLDLLEVLFEKHRIGYGSGGVTVIPVLVDQIAPERRLIEAAVEHAGGQFIDAHAPDYACGIDGVVEPDLRAIVASALVVPKDSGRGSHHITVIKSHGLVRAKLDGRDAGPAPNLGLQDLLGVAAAPFDRRLRETEFAVISYRDYNLDGRWADAVWTMFTQRIHGQAIASLQTLVLLVESRTPYEGRHFVPGGTGVSLAMWLSPDGMERRREWATNRDHIRTLRPQPGHVLVLFLGAGFSLSSGLQLGNGYRDRAIRDLLQVSDPPHLLGRLFYSWLADQHRLLRQEENLSPPQIEAFVETLTLERVLREEFYTRGGPRTSRTLGHIREGNDRAILTPGPAPRLLHRLLMRQDRNVIIATVNFDTLIEMGGGVRVFASDDEFDACERYLRDYVRSGGDVPLLKLHGTIERPETVVINWDTIALGLSEPKKRALTALANLASGLTGGGTADWAYVGCSMRDKDINPVIGLPDFAGLVNESWVGPFTAPTVGQFIASHRPLYGPDGLTQRSITETADVFFEVLEDAW